MNLRSLAVFVLLAAAAQAAGTKDQPAATPRPVPQFQIDTTPIDRNAMLRVSYAPVVKKASQSVVYISSTKMVHSRDMSQLFQDPLFRRFFGPMMPNQGGGGGQPQREESLGSGIIVSPNGYVLTNNHVVEGADEVKVRIGEAQKEYRATVVGRDKDADVAVLKIDATNLPAATLGDSDQLQVGDTVLAIGDPFGIGLTVTHGIVSALGRNDLGIEQFEDFIQTDAPINPGNSGGALLDSEGRVVGISTAIISHSGGSNGVGFAIPINLVRSIANQLVRNGKVSRGLLGVKLQELTPDLADQFGTTTGALVTEVEPSSPAEKAGIKSGDVITTLNGKTVGNRSELSFAVSELAPGTTVQVGYIRNGHPGSASVVLADRSDKAFGADNDNADSSNKDTGVLNGVAVTDITQEVRDELHIPDNIHGAIISDVASDSASAMQGLQKGDVILELAHKPVHNAQEAIKLSEQIPGPKVLVRFWRDGVTQYAVVDESQAPAHNGAGKGDSGGNGNGDGGDDNGNGGGNNGG